MSFFEINRKAVTFQTLSFVFLLSFSVQAQKLDSLNGRQVLIASSDKLDLAIRTQGGAIMSLVLKDDPNKLNPFHTGIGHFVCVDGFGPASEEEAKAGLPMHGEANHVPWKLVSSDKTGKTLTLAFSASLPLVQETFRRSFRMIDGENVVYVDSELESLLAFDRPVSWGEHATIGAPFLELGKTIVEMSSKKGMTRDHESYGGVHRLAASKEFTWPLAPGVNGGMVDIRVPPEKTPVADHTGSLMDPSRKFEFVTAFNAGKKMILGYIFRREEYPWLQLWENYPADGKLARGLEFAVQPFDVPRRQMITENSLFHTPIYRWLPARSKISSSFLLFWVPIPEGMTKVDDVTLENGKIVIEDHAAGKKITLNASRGL